MFKTYDVIGLINEGIMSIDGVLSDKPDQNGCTDLYQVETEVSKNVMIADFTTIKHGKESHDKYKITVEAIE